MTFKNVENQRLFLRYGFLRFQYIYRQWKLGTVRTPPPAFIVGCGHSGTSLLLSILGAHPRIFAVPGESGIALAGNRAAFLRTTREFTLQALRAGKARWAEKTPSHIHHMREILEWLPRARIVLIMRDGRDVAYSIKRRTGDLDKGIERWIEDNQAGLRWIGHPRVYALKYEELITDFKPTVEGLLSFIGETYHPQVEDHHKFEKHWYSDTAEKPPNRAKANHRAFRNWQIHQPLFDGRNQWKELPAAEITRIEEKAGPLMRQLGYLE